MRLRTWSALLVLLTACASAPAPQSMPRPHAFASTPTSSPRIRLVSAPMEPAPDRSWIGKADLDKARALLSRARQGLEPRQWEQLDRKLTAAERAFERFSRAARTSEQAAEVARGAEGLAQAGRAREAPLALSRVGPVLVALVLLWPSSTAGPESDSRPPWVDTQREFEARLRDVSESSRRLMVELEAQPRAAKAPAREPSPQKQPASALVEEDDPRCKPVPVPHLGGNDPHNQCADLMPSNNFLLISRSLSWIGAEMSAEQKSLNVIVYAPALIGDENRPLAIAQGMERSLPGLRLGWTTSEKDDLIALPNRDDGIVTDKANGGFFFLCNDDENRPVTLSGWENPDGLAAGGPPHFQVSASLPLDAVGIAAAVDVLEAVGDGAHAVWGKASLDGYGGVVAQQFRRQGDKPHVPPYGLPSLKRPRDNPAPEIPHYLGWLNYWSAATARAIGFPDPACDAELLSRARRTATGGWVVWLTDTPLDLDNPAHLDVLKRAYERFPEIGGRFTR